MRYLSNCSFGYSTAPGARGKAQIIDEGREVCYACYRGAAAHHSRRFPVLEDFLAYAYQEPWVCSRADTDVFVPLRGARLSWVNNEDTSPPAQLLSRTPPATGAH